MELKAESSKLVVYNNLQINPVGLAKHAWWLITVSSVDFAKPTGLKFIIIS